MNKGCRDFRSSFLLTDGEHPGDPHLAACEECRAFVQAEQSIKGLVRAHAPAWSASIALRERLATTLEQERNAGPRRAGLRRRAFVAAAIASLVAAGIWWGTDNAGRRRAHAMTELLVDDFLKYAPLGVERLQVSSGDAATVETFFSDQLQLAAKVPRLNGAVLVGGRRCNLAGRPAALVFLERHGPEGSEPLSLFVFEPGGEDWSAMKEAPGLRGRRACQHSTRGVGVLVWEERGLVYALAGAEEIGELVSLVEGHL